MLAKEPSNFLFGLILDVEATGSLDKGSNGITNTQSGHIRAL